MFLSLLLPASALAAADKSAVSLNSISLPSGPGSIEGLGESFQPTLNTGTAKYGIGLSVAPGTAGHTPDISIDYDAGGANGPLGYGWRLKVPFIQRQTDKGIPLYVDAADGVDNDRDGDIDEVDEVDVFVNDIGEELVPVQSSPEAPVDYFCENEGTFVRYRKLGEGWEGTLPNGTRMEFGLQAASRVQSLDDSAQPEPRMRMFAWMLERIIDTNGNEIHLAYTTFPGEENLNQVYLAKISYGPGAGPWENFHFLDFRYNTDADGQPDARQDWFEDCRAGFPVRTGVRLTEIYIGTQGPVLDEHALGDFNGDGSTDYLNRRYLLAYEGDTYWSLLSSVTQYGADNVSTLPPATFTYTTCNMSTEISAANAYVGSINEPPAIPGDSFTDFIDLNGDALPDLLETTIPSGSSYHRAYINLGEEETGGQRSIRWSNFEVQESADGNAWALNLESESKVTFLSDMTGDGVADLVYKTATDQVRYFENTAEVEWGPETPMSIQDFPPPTPFGAPNVKTADIDFDKNMDIIQSVQAAGSVQYNVWLNQGDQRFSEMLSVIQPQDTGEFLQETGVEINDFNGDRVPDVTVVRSPGVDVSAGLGYGRFLARRSVLLPDYLLTPVEIATAKIRDVTGDGLPDLVLERAAGGTELWYWANLGNYTFDVLRKIVNMPQTSLDAEVRWADINANGTTDIIYCDGPPFGQGIVSIDIGRLMGCVPKPRMIKTISNGIGRVTHIGYKATTKFLLEDGGWPDPLPFPVTVVSDVTTEDSLGNAYVTRFRYHDGYYDGDEKEFRGFVRVEQIEVGDDTAPTLVTQHFFDTGVVYDSMKGRLLRQVTQDEVADQDPDDPSITFWDERTQWTSPPELLYTGTDAKEVRYAHPVSKSRDVRERLAGQPGAFGLGADPPGPLRLECDMEFDQYGNQTVDANYGLVLDDDLSYQDDEQVSVTEYAVNTEKWILRALARQILMDEVAYNSWLVGGSVTGGQIVARTETFYDDPTFSGTNLGVVTIGNATMVRKWTDTSLSTAFITASRTVYDDYGNPVELLDPLAVAPNGEIDTTKGHYRNVAYDTLFQTYPVTETIHLENGKTDLAVHASYDEGFGRLVISIDFNGNVTSWGYDTFSRLINIVRPLDSQAFPTAEYDYYLAQPVGNGHLVNYIETRQLDKATPGSPDGVDRLDFYHRSRSFIDGLGRTLLTKEEAQDEADSGQPQVAVSGAVLFNQRRSAAKALHSFYTRLPGATLDDFLAFEDIRDASWTGAFHEDGQSVDLSLATAQVVTSTYDALQRTLIVTNPDGTQGRSEYFPLYTTSYDENDTDANSVHAATPMLHYNDGLGRLVRVDELAHLNDDGTFTAASDIRTWTTRYAYRLDGVLEKITDSQNNQKTMEYDALQRNTFMDDPDRGVMHYVYDDASNLLESTDAKDQQIAYTYDGANRILTEDFLDDAAPGSFHYNYDPQQPVTPANRPDVAYFYDVPAGTIDIGDGASGSADVNNAKGLLAYVWDLSGEEHVSYDERARAVWSVKRVPDPETGALTSYRSAMAYDSLDRLTTLTYPDDDRCSYNYGARTLLARINGGALHNRDGADHLLDGLTYAPSGQLLTNVFGNGVHTAYAYDNRQRLNHVRTAPSHLPEVVYLDYTYTFDNTQNLTKITDLRPASVLAGGEALRNTQTFQYDDLYRLTRVGYSFAAPGGPDAENHHIDYRYDRIGNMLAMDSDITQLERGVPVANVGAMHYGGELGPRDRVGRADANPGPHALTSAGHAGAERHFDYDPNGNMTVLDGLACTWDFADRLISVEDDRIHAEYIYDHTDRRIVKKVWNKKVGVALDTATQPPDLFTIYVNRSFEVREYEQPVKYVWNGENRIASITGTLDPTATRIQRVRLKAGWNLFAIVLNAPGAAAQLGLGSGAETVSAQRWDPAGQGFVPVGMGDTLPAGTILWMHVDTPRTLALRGGLPADTGLTLAAGGDFAAPMALEAAPTAPILEKVAPGWFYDARSCKWLPDVPAPVFAAPTVPAFLPPGAAVFTNTVTARNVMADHPERRIQYYHADHLGSSNTVTDAMGEVSEEQVFYPFGEVRTKRDAGAPKGPASVKYLFTQKEKDDESGLQYFEARYLPAGLGRFNRVDPLAESPPAYWMQIPQKLNPYAFCGNNPIRWHDPNGTDYGDISSSLDPLEGGACSIDEGWRSQSTVTPGAQSGGEWKECFNFSAQVEASRGFQLPEKGSALSKRIDGYMKVTVAKLAVEGATDVCFGSDGMSFEHTKFQGKAEGGLAFTGKFKDYVARYKKVVFGTVGYSSDHGGVMSIGHEEASGYGKGSVIGEFGQQQSNDNHGGYSDGFKGRVCYDTDRIPERFQGAKSWLEKSLGVTDLKGKFCVGPALQSPHDTNPGLL